MSEASYHTVYYSPLGAIVLESDGDKLTALRFDGQSGQCAFEKSAPIAHGLSRKVGIGELAVFSQTGEWLDRYFGGMIPGPIPPISFRSTPFRETVWELLSAIPYGRTAAYGELAEKIADRRGVRRISAQAVGGALAHNPILIVVPCHRVIGAGGDPKGYAGGIRRKEALLRLERETLAAEKRG